jgi:hypothetical protein
MEKEFIPYKIAVALKELGFESPYPIGGYQGGKVFYYENGELYYDGRPMYSSDAHSGQLLAPLYQQAFRFFREKCGLWQIVMQNTDKDWTYDIMTIIGMVDYKIFDVFDTYEEAELECLKKLIEIVNNKK